MRTERKFLVDVLGQLNQSQVDYMLTGSTASNYWETPRTKSAGTIDCYLPAPVGFQASCHSHILQAIPSSMAEIAAAHLRLHKGEPSTLAGLALRDIVKSCGRDVSGGGFLVFDSVDERDSLNHVRQ